MTTSNTTELSYTVFQTLVEATKAFNGAAAAQDRANKRREGSYSLAVRAAVEAEDGETLKQVYDALKVAIRSNADGIARSMSCKLGDPDKDGNRSYLVPASLQNAISCLLAAYEYGVPMVEEDGSARSFTAIRADKTAAAAAEREANSTPVEQARAKFVADLRGIIEAAPGMDMADLEIAAISVQRLAEIASGATKSEESDNVADALAA